MAFIKIEGKRLNFDYVESYTPNHSTKFEKTGTQQWYTITLKHRSGVSEDLFYTSEEERDADLDKIDKILKTHKI